MFKCIIFYINTLLTLFEINKNCLFIAIIPNMALPLLFARINKNNIHEYCEFYFVFSNKKKLPLQNVSYIN